MWILALTSLLVAATPETAEGSAQVNPPAPPSAADTVIAAAFGKDVGTKPADVKGESSTVGAQNLIAPVLGLAGLATLAFTLKRRRQRAGGSIHVIEATSLGDKRSLVIADVLGERLVLGVSEAGITVLMNKPAPAVEPEPFIIPAAPANPMGFFARFAGKAPAPAFDEALRESIEDQDLRAKLAAGVRSVVP